jgi:hypothetical protein
VSSSASGPQDAGGTGRPVSASGSPSERADDRALLERVLRQTLADSDSGAALDDADREALLEVARRHRGEPFALEPVAVALVHAVLLTHFQGPSGSSEFWRGVSLPIAGTLCDDPVMRGRMEALWDRLCERVT